MAAKKPEPTPEEPTITIAPMSVETHKTLLYLADAGARSNIAELINQPGSLAQIHAASGKLLAVVNAAQAQAE